MKSFEMLKEIMEKDKWVISKLGYGLHDNNIISTVLSRPVIGVAKSDSKELFLVMRITGHKDSYCFYKVGLKKTPTITITLKTPFVVFAQDIFDAVNTYNYLYGSDEFIGGSFIKEVYTKLGDFIQFNEDGEYSINNARISTITDLLSAYEETGYRIPFHPEFWNDDMIDVFINVLAVGFTETHKNIAITGLQLDGKHLKSNVLEINSKGLCISAYRMPEGCGTVKEVVETYNNQENPPYGKIINYRECNTI